MEVANIKTLFVISVLTSRMIMPGMPQMPANMGIPDMSAPTKTLNMDLTSDKKVNAKSTAQCAVPEGLKVGPKVDLAIDLPTKSTDDEAPGTADTGKVEKFVMKMYWDCSETVLPGQPKVMDSDKMMKGMPDGTMMSPGKARATAKLRLAAMADDSHAYWPHGKDNKKIVKESTSPGGYELTTSYCGGTSITFDKEQDFLAGIDVTSPGKGAIDLAKSIKVEWKTVPNAQAYVINAFAGKKGEMVMWTSCAKPDVNTDWMGTPFTKAQIADFIKKDILLPATATTCYIPAGIFKDISAPMITITAIGVDKQQAKNGIQTNVLVRSNAMIMAGRGMGGVTLEDEPPAEDTPDETTPPDSASSDSGEEDSTPPPAEKPKSAKDKAKDALNKLGNIFK